MLYEVFHPAVGIGFRVAFAVLPAAVLLAQKQPPAPAVKNIVLVHGALTDGSCVDTLT